MSGRTKKGWKWAKYMMMLGGFLALVKLVLGATSGPHRFIGEGVALLMGTPLIGIGAFLVGWLTGGNSKVAPPILRAPQSATTTGDDLSCEAESLHNSKEVTSKAPGWQFAAKGMVVGTAILLFGALAYWAKDRYYENISAPKLHQGEAWSYQVNNKNGMLAGDYKLTVLEVRPDGLVLINRSMTVPIKDSYNYLLSTNDWRNGTSGIESLKFPLYPGKTWVTKSSVGNLSNPTERFSVVEVITVIGWESVTVPAGTFNALKVVSVDGGGQMAKAGEEIYWYLPDAKALIKKVRDDGFVEVMTSMTPGRDN